MSLHPARSSLLRRPHHLQLRPYSSPPSSSSSPPPSNNQNSQKNNPNTRSNFKILPFLAIITLGSGSYALLVKSRVGATTTTQQ